MHPSSHLALAHDFIANEQQFHLGMIPTEQSNPLTKGFSQTIQRDTKDGVRKLLTADSRVADVALECFNSPEFAQLTNSIRDAMDHDGAIILSSVGASGRLALQLDATWRRFWYSLIPRLPIHAKRFTSLASLSQSFMTGGDRAVVRSVENFEDYMTFGARQMRDAIPNPKAYDIAIILSECGLSASVNGSAIASDDLGMTTFYIYCNPREILCEHLDRCRQVFDRTNIVKIPLFVGNMAIAGSTRMQVTTVELLVVGAAQELAISSWLADNLTPDELQVVGDTALSPEDYAQSFTSLLDQLSSGAALDGLAQAIEYETDTYTRSGLITYFAHDYLQDILTDTTERQPTFTLPPFRKPNDTTSPTSWAYAKDPTLPAGTAWQHILQRPIRGLDWTHEDYISMNASKSIIDNPPEVSSEELTHYKIGWERDPSRTERHPSRLIYVDINDMTTIPSPAAPSDMTDDFDETIRLHIGSKNKTVGLYPRIDIPVNLPRTLLDLPSHLMVKLAFNTISTGAMAKMGRIWSNWMIQVLPTNKKLIDRSVRIIASLAQIPYERACEEFYRSYLNRGVSETYRESYVVETLRRLGVEY